MALRPPTSQNIEQRSLDTSREAGPQMPRRRRPPSIAILSILTRATYAYSDSSDLSRHRRRLSQPVALSINMSPQPAFYLGMQTLLTSSNGRDGQLPYSKTSLRLRAFRFLSERFAQRERPSVAAEFVLFAVIVLTSTWSILVLAHAMKVNL